jgi:soluble lytic murein transglycosylase-like protein
MSSQLVLRLAVRALALGAVLTVTPLVAAGQATRLVDADGITHVTNVPLDPRYRGLPGAAGREAGWSRLTGHARGRHHAAIHEISRQHGVSPALVEAVVRAESGFDPGAISPKGAGGLMQLMPATAAALGVTDRFEPRQSISGGVRHLRYLLDRYRGSVALALAAYNAGEAAVDSHRGVPPYPETRQYIRRVLTDAGMSASIPGTGPTLYRYRGLDDTLTYSNRPPAPGTDQRRPIF